MIPDPAVLVIAFVFGSMLGSFLNVVIHRLPEKRSIVWPGSHCPACEAPIGWYDNVPILSWLVLGGKCRKCRARISPRYLVVEALTGGLVLALAARYLTGDAKEWGRFLVSLVFLAALVPVTFIDLKLRIIPDRITKPGMVLAPVCSLLVPEMQQLSLLSGVAPRPAALVLSLLGMLAGAGAIWLMGVAGKAVFKKDAMGFGDVKLMGMLGGFLGPIGVLMAILLACVIGAVVGVLGWAITRSHYIPFGPFLSLGAVAVHFFRPELIEFFTVTYPGLFR